MQPIQAACATRLLHDEPGRLQQAEMTRDRRPADRQGVGQLADRAPARRTFPEQLDDGPSIGVAERLERIAGGAPGDAAANDGADDARAAMP